MISEIVKQAIEDKIAELEANKKIIEKACGLLEEKLDAERKEHAKLDDKIEELKAFLGQDTDSAAEPKKRPGRKKKEQKEGDAEMSTDAKKEYDRMRYKKKKTEEEAKKNGEEEKPEPVEDLHTIITKARECGMSYGQYMAQQQIERQHEEMAEARLRRKLLAAGGEGNDGKGILGQD